MYLLRVGPDVLAHLKQLADLEVIQARSVADTKRAAALKQAVASALQIGTDTPLVAPYRVEIIQSRSLSAYLWEHARIVAQVPLMRETVDADVDRAYCMAHALALRQIAEAFLRMEWSPTPEIQEMLALVATARKP